MGQVSTIALDLEVGDGSIERNIYAVVNLAHPTGELDVVESSSDLDLGARS